jgi:hypothetical protein
MNSSAWKSTTANIGVTLGNAEPDVSSAVVPLYEHLFQPQFGQVGHFSSGRVAPHILQID